jgi:hypothetical protein
VNTHSVTNWLVPIALAIDSSIWTWLFIGCCSVSENGEKNITRAHRNEMYLRQCNLWAVPIGTSCSIHTHLVALLQRGLHTVWSNDSIFNFQHPPASLKSLSGCLCLLPCFTVTSILFFIFFSIMCFRRQFLRKMWLIQLTFLSFKCVTSFRCSLCSGQLRSLFQSEFSKVHSSASSLNSQ